MLVTFAKPKLEICDNIKTTENIYVVNPISSGENSFGMSNPTLRKPKAAPMYE